MTTSEAWLIATDRYYGSPAQNWLRHWSVAHSVFEAQATFDLDRERIARMRRRSAALSIAMAIATVKAS